MIRYAITDRMLYGTHEPARRAALVAQAGHLARTDIDFLLLREKDLPSADLVTLARQLRAELHQHTPAGALAPRLLISSRPDIAIAAAADGVHLTSSPAELRPDQVRALYTQAGLPTPVISASAHTLADIHRLTSSAPHSPPDLLLFGPVFEKVIRSSSSSTFAVDTRLHDGSGLDLLHQACTAAAPVPVLALGGITPENTSACLHAGAAGIAAIRLFQLPPDPTQH